MKKSMEKIDLENEPKPEGGYIMRLSTAIKIRKAWHDACEKAKRKMNKPKQKE